jgi:hypothetical protein
VASRNRRALHVLTSASLSDKGLLAGRLAQAAVRLCLQALLAQGFAYLVVCTMTWSLSARAACCTAEGG